MVDTVCLNEALLEGAKEVFETMIFMPLEKADDQSQQIEGNCLLGTITFKGELEGCLAICCSTPSAKAIALNMLAMDPEDDISEEDINDAIGEVANMVMGSIKARIQESIGTLEVSIPSVISGQHLENNLGEGANRISTKVNIAEDYLVELRLLYREESK